ncbi:TPA: class I SAM-dependent methyltransferase [Candidatus Poribacteria bacterium]|nr:class I SAM-dependent methyltransferase [Candidatus Poribacteria bacterium]
MSHSDKFIKFKRYVSQNRFLSKISSCPYRSPIWDKRVAEIIKNLGSEANVLDLGSGIRRRAKHIINLEIDVLPNVDIVADGHNLPFKDAVFDAVIIEAVLEHVKDPKRIISEVKRILRPSGYICVAIPFMQGYHASPTDYQRYTIDGLNELLSDFEMVECGSCVGPTSALHWIFREYVGILFSFGNIWLYKIISLFIGWLTFPFVYLDYILLNYKNSHNIASAIYFIGKNHTF